MSLIGFFAIYRFVNWVDFLRRFAAGQIGSRPRSPFSRLAFALNISMDVVQRV
jgi:hypothetical protein